MNSSQPGSSGVIQSYPGQEYWDGLPFPSPGDLPDPETEPGASCIAGRFFTISNPNIFYSFKKTERQVHPWLDNIYSIFFEISKNQKKHISIKYSHKNVLDINKGALWDILTTEGIGMLLHLLPLSKEQLQHKLNLLTIQKPWLVEENTDSIWLRFASLDPVIMYVFKAQLDDCYENDRKKNKLKRMFPVSARYNKTAEK